MHSISKQKYLAKHCYCGKALLVLIIVAVWLIFLVWDKYSAFTSFVQVIWEMCL